MTREKNVLKDFTFYFLLSDSSLQFYTGELHRHVTSGTRSINREATVTAYFVETVAISRLIDLR